jgi:chromate reductase
MTVKLLAFAASLRKDSWNRKLVRLAVDAARKAGAEVDLADFHQFDMPLYDGDIQQSAGIPTGAQELIHRIEAVDGVMISSPEYNFSLPGTLKNAIDWVSRARPMPLRGKSGLLLGASTAQVGAIRGLWQLRIPLEGLGVFVYPDMYTLPWADKQFDENGGLKEGDRAERLVKTVTEYVGFAGRLRGEGKK